MRLIRIHVVVSSVAMATLVGANDGEPPVAAQVQPADATQPEKPRVTQDPRKEWVDDTDTFNRQVAATVNGVAILKGEVIDRCCYKLSRMREVMQQRGDSQADYNTHRNILVQIELCPYLQAIIIAEAMTSQLTAEEIVETNLQIGNLFKDREVDKLMRELKVSTRQELEAKLHDLGSNLENIRKRYFATRMVNDFILRESSRAISQADVRSYYQSHVDDYYAPATVDWEQIQMTFFDENARVRARDLMKQIRQDVEGQVSVAVAAAKYSDGPTARQGGLRKSTKAGDVDDRHLEQLLFEMPIGKWSEIHEGPSEFQLVRVVSRSARGPKPLNDVEGEIRTTLMQKHILSQINEVLSGAKVESEFDLSDLKSFDFESQSIHLDVKKLPKK